MTIKCQYVTCFIQRKGIYQSLIMFVEVNHVTNNEINEDLGKRVVDVAHQSRTGYKTISKEFGLHKSTNHSTNPQSDRCVQMEEIHDHCYLREKWLTNKDLSKAEHIIVCKVAKVPRITSKQPKAFLTLANVHEPTIRRHWATMVCMAELQEESHCSPNRKLLAKDYVN